MNILGINSAYHESSAAIIKDGRLLAMAEEERFNRVKHAKPSRVDNPDELPIEAINFCLKTAGIEMKDIDYIGYSLFPKDRIEKNTAYKSPYPLAEGGWGTKEGEEIFYQHCLRVPAKLSEIYQTDITGKFHFIPHHLCHAASCYLVSPFKEAAILVVDGIAEFSGTWQGFGKDGSMEKITEIDFPDSLGFLWEKFSKFLGFSEYDACKVMGLATCGKFYIPEYIIENFEKIVKLKDDGSFTIDDDILCSRNEDYTKLTEIFHKIRRDRSVDPTATIQELVIAQALQRRTGKVIVHMAEYLLRKTGSKNLCLAGGTALNSVVNGKIEKKIPGVNLFIQPAANDAGTSLGAAYYIWNCVLNNPKSEVQALTSAYWGPEYSNEEIKAALEESGLGYEYIAREEELVKQAASLLAEGKIIGWFQGRMEIGPRALGNRSVLANPSDSEVREKINSKGVKNREEFRPFAPSVLEEEAPNWFYIKGTSPYMLKVHDLKPEKYGMADAIVHYDGTSRIQTVDPGRNPRYHKLIKEFFSKTGIPMVLNTSFNSDEPIVRSPQDAVKTFKRTGLDCLFLGNFMVSK